MSSASQPVSKLSAAADNNSDRESLNDLISLIYDSVVDPSRWASACAKVAGCVGGVGTGGLGAGSRFGTRPDSVHGRNCAADQAMTPALRKSRLPCSHSRRYMVPVAEGSLHGFA
jgi:hypothetical protein